MNKLCLKKLKQLSLKITLFTAVSLVSAEAAKAQTYFPTFVNGDVVAGFRKTGQFAENNEMVVRLGNITNFLSLSVGTTIPITNYSITQITNLCPDNLENLQWSVFATFPTVGVLDGAWVTPVGSFPSRSCWFTVPRTDFNTQTVAPIRQSPSIQGTLRGKILSVSTGASTIEQDLSATNQFSNIFVATEPVAFPDYILTTFIGDAIDPTFGDFGGGTLTFGVENTTPSPFSSPQRCDFYQCCSAGAGLKDPITGTTNGPAYFVGYFTLNTDGTMSFTRAAASTGGGTPPPRPVLSIMTLVASGGGGGGGGGSQVTSTISFGTTNGATYTLYFTNATGLTTPVTNWPSMPSTITGDGSMHAFTNSSGDPSRFYSVGAH